MRYILHIGNNEKGSALIISILILLLLTIIGIAATNTSTIEILISGNDKVHKMAFHQAEGGTEVGRELLEQNIACPTGFKNEPIDIGNTRIEKKDFWQNESNATTCSYPSDSNRDIHMPANATSTDAHTNIKLYGVTELSTGTAIQMAAGYEGKGKGAATGGGHIVYDLCSQRRGQASCESCIAIQYRHVIGQEGVCIY